MRQLMKTGRGLVEWSYGGFEIGNGNERRIPFQQWCGIGTVCSPLFLMCVFS